MTHPSYETDFYQWTQAQAEALRAKASEDLDWDNLAEEIESLGKSDRRAVESYLEVIATHVLKWVYQPQERTRRGRRRRNSIEEARRQLQLIIEDSPSLRERVPVLLARAYPHARRKAHRETGLPLATFPEACPWPPELLQEADFLPEELPGAP